MQMKRQQPLSHLFTVRLWQEELGNGQTEVRGKVQHVSSGEVRYFRDWPMLAYGIETFTHLGRAKPRKPLEDNELCFAAQVICFESKGR